MIGHRDEDQDRSEAMPQSAVRPFSRNRYDQPSLIESAQRLSPFGLAETYGLDSIVRATH